MEGLITVEDDSPIRCQAVTANGQCRHMATFEDKCPMHARALTKRADKAEARNYRLSKFQARVDDFANSDKIKSLREEIGIVRMLIEEVINRCNSATDLILMSNKISHLIDQAQKLVTSCHRLEASTGMLLDKTAILQLSMTIVEIVHQYVKDDTQIDQISERIVSAVMTAQPSPDDDTLTIERR